MTLLKAFGQPNIEKLKAKVDVRGLLKVLAKGESRIEIFVSVVRSTIAELRFKLGDLSAIQKDSERYDQSFEMSSAAQRALREIGVRAVAPLIFALGDKNKAIRYYAAAYLGHIGDIRAVEALIVALKDHDKLVRSEAAIALGKIKDNGAIGALEGALKDDDRSVRESASKALGYIGHTKAVGSLEAALHDKDDSVRRAATEAIQSIKGRQSDDGA